MKTSDKDYCMKDLSVFVKNEFVKKEINKLFNNIECVYIENFEDCNRIANEIGYGKHMNVSFKNGIIKDRFIDLLSSIRTDINVINCNCSLDCFFENDFSGFLVFNNLKRCQYTEIINEIKKHGGIILS